MEPVVLATAPDIAGTLEYAQQYLVPKQIDTVDVEAYLNGSMDQPEPIEPVTRAQHHPVMTGTC